jgi:hypothetical protein
VPLIISAGGSDTTISTSIGDNRISGTAEHSATVTLELIDSQGLITFIGSKSADPGGNFGFSLSNDQLANLPQGSGMQLQARITDNAGNIAISQPFRISVDTVAPVAPTISTIGGSDSIISSLTGDNQIIGSAPAYSTVFLEAELADSTTAELGTSIVNGKGVFSYGLSALNLANLGQGLRKFWAVLTDSAGNRSRSNFTAANIYTEAKEVPTLLAVGGVDGVISSGSGDQLITGQAIPGRPVTLEALVPGSRSFGPSLVSLATVLPDDAGLFRFTLSRRNLQDLGQGSGFQLFASQNDPVGNIGRSTAFSFSIDTVAPTAPQIASVGGADSVVTNVVNTAGTDTLVRGTALPGSEVTLLGSNGTSTYRTLAVLRTAADGIFQYLLTKDQLASFKQGAGQLLMASVSDPAGNIASSSPFTFSLDNEAPSAPSLNGLFASGGTLSFSYDAAAASAGGLRLSGKALGAAEVEVRIGINTFKSTTPVNSRGDWSILISNTQLPVSATLTTAALELTALGLYGDRSSSLKATLQIDTATPTVLDMIQEGSKIRILLDEFVALPNSSVLSDFSVRAGTRTIALQGISQIAGAHNGTELVLQLAETLTTSAVVKVSYGGSLIGDAVGNKLSTFSNKILTHYASSNSIASPAYSYETLELTGSDNLALSGNDYDNRLLGNSGDNEIKGARGADIITGGLGRDTFLYTSFADSLLLDPMTRRASIDRITDFAIGTDIIDGPYAIAPAALLQKSSAQALSSANLSAILPKSVMPAYGGAIVSFGTSIDTQRTFLVLNDGSAGYSQLTDSLIEITGYTGQINNLRVI